MTIGMTAAHLWVSIAVISGIEGALVILFVY